MIYEIDTYLKLRKCWEFEREEFEEKIKKILSIFKKNIKFKKEDYIYYNDEIFTIIAIEFTTYDRHFYVPTVIIRCRKINKNMQISQKTYSYMDGKIDDLEIITYDEATELVGKPRNTKSYKDKRLYVFRNPYNLIKIGISSNIQERKSALEMASGYDLEILKIINKPELESKLHKKFKHLKVKGEWFKFTDEVRLEIAKL